MFDLVVVAAVAAVAVMVAAVVAAVVVAVIAVAVMVVAQDAGPRPLRLTGWGYIQRFDALLALFGCVA